MVEQTDIKYCRCGCRVDIEDELCPSCQEMEKKYDALEELVGRTVTCLSYQPTAKSWLLYFDNGLLLDVTDAYVQRPLELEKADE